MTRLLISAICILASIAHARADTITVSFTGRVDGYSGSYPFPGVNLNDSLSGSFQYDTSVADSNPDSRFGQYSGALTGLTFSIGAFTATGPGAGNYVFVNDEWTNKDEFGLRSGTLGSSNTVSGFQVVAFAFDLTDNTHSTYSSDALPHGVDTEPFDYTRFWVTVSNGSTYREVSGKISIEAAAVPAPTAVVSLLGLGMTVCGFGWLRKPTAVA